MITRLIELLFKSNCSHRWSRPHRLPYWKNGKEDYQVCLNCGEEKLQFEDRIYAK